MKASDFNGGGLVLEGGAMRGLFTVGVMDALMDAGIEFGGVVGVSAGAAFGCNYVSRQRTRGLRYNKLLAKNWRHCSFRSLLLTGDLFGAKFAYHIVPNSIDIFDGATFEANPTEFHVVCTDVTTGLSIYKRLDRWDYDTLEWIRASASMPLCSRIVKIGNHRLLDGGVSDSIPLQYFEQQGFNRNIVVLTQPQGYRKKSSRGLTLLMRLWMWRHPRFADAIARRPEMYNAQLDYVAQAEARGDALVIRPPYPLPIGHTCHNPELMQRIYDIGLKEGRRAIAGLIKPETLETPKTPMTPAEN